MYVHMFYTCTHILIESCKWGIYCFDICFLKQSMLLRFSNVSIVFIHQYLTLLKSLSEEMNVSSNESQTRVLYMAAMYSSPELYTGS